MDIPADLTWTAITLVSLSAITTSIISAIAGMGGGILLLIICPFIGTNIGIKILKNIDEKKFRLIFKAALLMAALRIFFYKLS